MSSKENGPNWLKNVFLARYEAGIFFWWILMVLCNKHVNRISKGEQKLTYSPCNCAPSDANCPCVQPDYRGAKTSHDEHASSTEGIGMAFGSWFAEMPKFHRWPVRKPPLSPIFFALPCRSLQILTAYQSEWIRMVIAFQSIARHTAIGFTPSTPRSESPKFPPAIRSKYEASGRLGVLGTGCNGSSHPLQFLVQEYLSNTQYVDCTRYYMIVSYCTSTHPMQRPFSGYNSGTWSDPTVGHPHPRHSVSSTELAVVPHGATRES